MHTTARGGSEAGGAGGGRAVGQAWHEEAGVRVRGAPGARRGRGRGRTEPGCGLRGAAGAPKTPKAHNAGTAARSHGPRAGAPAGRGDPRLYVYSVHLCIAAAVVYSVAATCGGENYYSSPIKFFEKNRVLRVEQSHGALSLFAFAI